MCIHQIFQKNGNNPVIVWFGEEGFVYWHSVSYTMKVVSLTSKQPGWYLNFISWFMKNVLFEQKKIRLWSKHFVENKMDYATYLKNALNSSLPDYKQWISSCLLYICLCLWMPVFKRFNTTHYEALLESRGIALPLFSLYIRWMWAVIFMLQPLYCRWESPQLIR